MLNKVRKYRWELWLFFGVSVVTWITNRLVGEVVEDALNEGAFYGTFGRVDIGWIVWPALLVPISVIVLLGISYWWVNRLERPLLRIVWQYALAVAALDIVRYSAGLAMIQDSTLSRSGWEAIWLLSIGSTLLAIQIGALVWLARRASKGGFDKSLVIIGISAFSILNVAYSANNLFRYGVGYKASNVIMLLAVIALTLVAVWALKCGDTEKAIGRKGFAMLFGAAFFSLLAMYVVREGGNSAWRLDDAAWSASIHAGIYAIAIGVAYAVRMRLPKEEPPSEEPVNPTTLLYGGTWKDSS